MKIEEFLVERWMDTYENEVKINLGETCIKPFSIEELAELVGEEKEKVVNKILTSQLSYGDIIGSENLRKGIATLYSEIKEDDILICHGAAGANFETMMSIVEPTDNTVCVVPNYQQHYSIPKSIGAEVRLLKLEEKDAFSVHIKKLRKLVDEKTKLISIANPNNPLGLCVEKEIMLNIVEIAREVGAYILCDEAYRGIDDDIFSICDYYEKGIATGSFSKIFSAAGIRQGWVATKAKEVIEEIKNRRDYEVISCGVINDYIASMIINNKEKVIERNKKIVFENRKILHDFIKSTNEDFIYHKPEAGTTALVFYNKDISSYDFCKKVIKEKETLIVPGDCFMIPKSFRIGYVYDAKKLSEGLENIYEVYKTL